MAPPFVSALAAYGPRLALVERDVELDYAGLAVRVGQCARQLGPQRRLVLVVGEHTIATVAAYLGALAGGHAVLLVPGERSDHVDGWIARYDPDVVVRRGVLQVRRPGSAHELHPELALLMATSGSTGSPRLVRLSAANVQSNAEAVVEVLGIGAGDRAVTTLPMAYCYGLSVLHSHLLAGASVVLTDTSVADPGFVELCRTRRITSLAGVPHTYALLASTGALEADLPDLRCLTQAGGRLPPERVRELALAAERSGRTFIVMYGQTEATARITCLPASLAAQRPESVGRVLPGSALRLDDGELVLTGPGVMLGYADEPADLALGRTVTELRTGDLASVDADGVVVLVGRRSRIAKVLGLRVDLATVERAVEQTAGAPAWCADQDPGLVVLVEAGHAPTLRRVAATAAGLPHHAVRVVPVAGLPRSANGKVDGPAAAALARAEHPRPAGSVAVLYAEVLGRTDVAPGSTFVGLGGDSLSYIELATRLEQLLGELPRDWPQQPVARLQSRAAGARPLARSTRLETSVVLRAVAIALVVGSHSHLFQILGGAHALLAVAGFNLARFRLAAPTPARGVLRAAGRLAVPSALCIGAAALVTPGLGPAQIAFVNTLLGPDTLGPAWRYWFVEALVQIMLVVGLLLHLPPVARLVQRRPFASAAGLFALALLTRFELVALPAGPAHHQSAPAVLWLFALGWWAATAVRPWQRVVVSAAAVVTVPGFWGDPARELVVLAAVLALLWTSSLPVPAVARPIVAVVAGSSLAVYLTHWQVLPVFEGQPLPAFLASLVVGALVHRGGGAALDRLRHTRYVLRIPSMHKGVSCPSSSRCSRCSPRRPATATNSKPSSSAAPARPGPSTSGRSTRRSTGWPVTACWPAPARTTAVTSTTR